METPTQLVIVEDNPMYLEMLASYFRSIGDYEVKTYATGEACLAEMQGRPDAYLLDYDLDPMEQGGISGLELLQRLRQLAMDAPALFLTGHVAVQPAAEIIKGGAFAYMRKELSDLSKVSDRIEEMVEWQRMKEKVAQLKQRSRRQRARMAVLVGLLLSVMLGVIFWP